MMKSNTASRRFSRILLWSMVLLATCAAALLGYSKSDGISSLLGYSKGDGISSLYQPTSSWCPKAFFNFGDSLTDTGNLVLARPFTSEAEHLPYGENFFEKPTGRFSNGRLVPDFLLLSFKLPLLDPYLRYIPNNTLGFNFAYAGATAEQDGFLVPFNLKFQVGEFVRLKNGTLEAQQSRASNLTKPPDQTTFKSALYIIGIGGNDVMGAFLKRLPSEVIFQQVVPDTVQEITSAVQTLYLQDARKFMIFNIPPEGCATVFLSYLNGLGLPLDSLGCITAVNAVNQAINSALFKAVQHLRASLPGVTITYFDYYSANIEILTNPSKYGFNPRLLQTACCGCPGVGILNFNQSCMCGLHLHSGFTTCDNPDQYIIWDGIHFTEAFYRVIAKFVLNGEFSDPPTNLTAACNLSFKDFDNTTYEQVFPKSSLLLL